MVEDVVNSLDGTTMDGGSSWGVPAAAGDGGGAGVWRLSERYRCYRSDAR